MCSATHRLTHSDVRGKVDVVIGCTGSHAPSSSDPNESVEMQSQDFRSVAAAFTSPLKAPQPLCLR